MPDDARGVLQDVHWTRAAYGYFPTYALGNALSVQIWRVVEQELPDLDAQLEAGEFGPLYESLRERLYRHGRKFTPMETLERAIGADAIDPPPRTCASPDLPGSQPSSATSLACACGRDGALRDCLGTGPEHPREGRSLRSPSVDSETEMEDVLLRSQALVESFEALVRAELPEGAEIFDAHVHLGTDIDGMVGDFDELVAGQERYGISGAFMFCLDEPDRHPSFSAANDRTLAYAERSNGRFVPFVRLDVTEEPIAEAIRCLDAGARGIKLHPRAQKFQLNDERLAPVFELAAERERPDPDPRRARPAADRRRPRRARRALRHPADHRPLRHRRVEIGIAPRQHGLFDSRTLVIGAPIVRRLRRDRGKVTNREAVMFPLLVEDHVQAGEHRQLVLGRPRVRQGPRELPGVVAQ